MSGVRGPIQGYVPLPDEAGVEKLREKYDPELVVRRKPEQYVENAALPEISEDIVYQPLSAGSDPNYPYHVEATDDGRKYYPATIFNRETKKDMAIKVFIIDKLPTAKQQFRDDKLVGDDMGDYTFLEIETGGGNGKGAAGGRYNYWYTVGSDPLHQNKPLVRSQILFCKQDTHIPMRTKLLNGIAEKLTKKNIIEEKPEDWKVQYPKIIGEYVTGQILGLGIGESAAATFYAISPPAMGADGKPLPPDGRNIYVASPVYDNGQDLYLDIKRVNGITPTKATKRPKRVGTSNKAEFVKGTIQGEGQNATSLYHNWPDVAAGSLWAGDFDVHSGNFLVLANRNKNNAKDPKDFMRVNGEIVRDADDKIGVLVKIDHGGGTRMLTPEVHIESRWRHFPVTWKGWKFIGTQPTNHFREYARSTKVSQEFAAALDRLASIDPATVKASMQFAMDETDRMFTKAKIPPAIFARATLDYAKRVGIELPFKNLRKKITALEKTGGPDALNELKTMKDGFLKQTADFVSDMLILRQKSMKNLSMDIKISLCTELLPDGKFAIVKNPPYNLAELISEDPNYFIEHKFRFRKDDQSMKIFGSRFAFLHTPFLKPVADKMKTDAALQVLSEALGKSIQKDSSKYSFNFYNNEKNKKDESPAPAGVRYIKVVETEFNKNLPAMLRRQKRLSPNISFLLPEDNIEKKPIEYGLNFVKNSKKGIAGLKGLYIEKIGGNNFQITAHRLPPEINARYIFSNILRNYCGEEALGAIPTLLKDIQKICGDMDPAKISANNIFGLKTKGAEKTATETLLLKLISDNIKIKEAAGLQAIQAAHNTTPDEAIKIFIATTLSEKYHTTTTQKTRSGIEIPCNEYLRFAELQYESFRLRAAEKGVLNPVMDIHNDLKTNTPSKDKLVSQAYMIVCKMHGQVYKNNSGHPDPSNAFRDADVKRYLDYKAQIATPARPSPPAAPAV